MSYKHYLYTVTYTFASICIGSALLPQSPSSFSLPLLWLESPTQHLVLLLTLFSPVLPVSRFTPALPLLYPLLTPVLPLSHFAPALPLLFPLH